MIDKTILKIKKTEHLADKIIKDANDKAGILVDNANKEAEKLIERIKEEAKKEGKMIIEREEKLARIEADIITKKSEKERKEIGKKSLTNIDKVVKIVIKKVVEGN